MILCIGDIMLDRYVYGEATRISPEAPVPVVKIEREEVMLGGVGNVARNIASLGGNPALVAVVGNDKAGYDITDLCGKLDAEVALITDPGRQSTVKQRYVAGNQQVVRVDREQTNALSAAAAKQLRIEIGLQMPGAEAVIVSDYSKGVVSRLMMTHLLAEAKRHAVPVIVDPKSADFNLYRGANVITPNLKELEAAYGKKLSKPKEIHEAAGEMMSAYGFEAMLVTCGKDGMHLIAKGYGRYHVPARARQVYDVSGAGDTAVAAFALSVARNETLVEAARFANKAASIAVGKRGTAAVTAKEVA